MYPAPLSLGVLENRPPLRPDKVTRPGRSGTRLGPVPPKDNPGAGTRGPRPVPERSPKRIDKDDVF